MAKSNKYIVWMHQSETSSTGTQPMPGMEARKVAKEYERSIVKSNGCLPAWPKIEIRRADNPPRKISK